MLNSPDFVPFCVIMVLFVVIVSASFFVYGKGETSLEERYTENLNQNFYNSCEKLADSTVEIDYSTRSVWFDFNREQPFHSGWYEVRFLAREIDDETVYFDSEKSEWLNLKNDFGPIYFRGLVYKYEE